jgi:uncharacterized RDD family membrane protein YckC
MATATVAATATNKGGFWIRLVAYLIDAIILGIVGTIIGGFVDPDPSAPARNSINLLLGLVYFVYFWSAQGGGQTLGMRVLNLKVIRTDGSALTYVQAVIRYVGLIIACIPIFIGVIWAAFDANKQGWHDKIAGTFVVKTK